MGTGRSWRRCVCGGGLLQHRVLLRTTCMAVKHIILVRHSCGSRLAADGFAVPILNSHLLPVDTATPSRHGMPANVDGVQLVVLHNMLL